MASADDNSTLDIDKALDVASRRKGYERLFPKQREAVEAFISGSDVAVRVFTNRLRERASVSLSLSGHALLPHRAQNRHCFMIRWPTHKYCIQLAGHTSNYHSCG